MATALIAAGSAMAGGAIAAGSNWLLHGAARRDARRDELRRLLTAFIEVVQEVDRRLRTAPAPGKIVRRTNEQVQRWPYLDTTLGQLRQRLLEPDVDRFVSALDHVVAEIPVMAPHELLRVVEETTKLIAAFDVNRPTEPGWWEEWEVAKGEALALAADC